jgi:hypothetical protein
MNNQDQTTTTETTETATEATESFTVVAHDSDDLQVQPFERGPLTDLNFGF